MSNPYIQPYRLEPVILTTSSGETHDITSQVKEINLYESLFSNVITAEILLQDIASNRITQKGMLGAKDKISIEFSGKTKDLNAEPSIKVELYVYKIKSGAPLGQALQTTSVYLASEEFFKNSTKEISRFFEGKVSTIVETICNEIGISDIETEQTEGDYSFLATYNSPFEIINSLTNKAISTRNSNDYNYVFYEDLDKKYHFISIGSLFEKPSKYGTDSTSGFIHTLPLAENSNLLKNMVLGYECSEISPLKNAMGGMYTSQILTFDFINKWYELLTFDFITQLFKSQTHLSNKRIIEGNDAEFKKTLNSSYLTRYAQKGEYCFDCDQYKGFQDKIGGENDIVLSRLSSSEELNQLSITISINGNSTIRAGDIFFFGRPAQQQLSKDKDPDIIFNGKYLAVEICHSIKNNFMNTSLLKEYKTTIRAIKESIGDE